MNTGKCYFLPTDLTPPLYFIILKARRHYQQRLRPTNPAQSTFPKQHAAQGILITFLQI